MRLTATWSRARLKLPVRASLTLEVRACRCFHTLLLSSATLCGHWFASRIVFDVRVRCSNITRFTLHVCRCRPRNTETFSDCTFLPIAASRLSFCVSEFAIWASITNSVRAWSIGLSQECSGRTRATNWFTIYSGVFVRVSIRITVTT